VPKFHLVVQATRVKVDRWTADFRIENEEFRGEKKSEREVGSSIGLVELRFQ
jgi:hypothetical protein